MRLYVEWLIDGLPDVLAFNIEHSETEPEPIKMAEDTLFTSQLEARTKSV